MRLNNYKLLSLLLFLTFVLFLVGCDFSKDDDDDDIRYIANYERINFWDTNWEPYKLGGTLVIDRDRNESRVAGYQLYWGWDDHTKVLDNEGGLICSWTKASINKENDEYAQPSSSVSLGNTDKLEVTFSRGDVSGDPIGLQKCQNLPSDIPEKLSYKAQTQSIQDESMDVDLKGIQVDYKVKATYFLLFTNYHGSSGPQLTQAFPIKDNFVEYLATMAEDIAYDVAVDAQGRIYVAGATRGDMINQQISYDSLYYFDYRPGDLVYENYSFSDAFLKKYDPKDEIVAYDDRNVSDKYPDVESASEIFTRTTARMNYSGPENQHASEAWLRQWGGIGSDAALAVKVGPEGNVYVAGYTLSNQRTNPDDVDYFLAKYSKTGDRLWQRQEGTERDDIGNDLAMDRYGNIYVVGVTGGALAGPHHGKADIFIFKYNSNGQKIWQRQIGTSASEAGHALAVDRYDNVTLVGETAVDESGDNNKDGGGTVGFAGYEARGRDAFIIKTDRFGSILWRKEIKTDKLDRAYDVALDSHGNAYVAGESYENLSQLAYYLEQNMDKNEVYGPYLLKYDPYGNLIWVKHPGSKALEESQSRGQSRGHARSVIVDSLDNIYVTGTNCNSRMEYVSNAISGSQDSFLLRYDVWGNEVWQKHIGTKDMDEGFGLAVGGGGVYLVGSSNGYLANGRKTAKELQERYNYQAQKDAFIIRPNLKLSQPYAEISKGDFLKYKDRQWSGTPYVNLGNGVGFHPDCNTFAATMLAFSGIVLTNVAVNSFYTAILTASGYYNPLAFNFPLPIGPTHWVGDIITPFKFALNPQAYFSMAYVVSAGLYMGHCYDPGHH